MGYRLKEDWNYNSDISKYIDQYKDENDRDNFSDDLDYHNFYTSIKDEISDLNNDLFYFQIDVDKEGKASDYLNIKVYDRELDYPFDGLYASNVLDPVFRHEFELNEEQLADYLELYNKLTEEINYINAGLEEILTSYGMQRVRKGHKLRAPTEINLVEAFHVDDRVYLTYPDLKIDVTYGPKDWDTGMGIEEFEGEIEYDFPVDKQDIEEFLADFLYGRGEEEFDKLVDAEDHDGYYSYIDTNFDRLLDKYYDDVLEAFRDKATEHAIEHIDFDEYFGHR